MRRIVIFSDSLALPRKEPQETIYEDTYPFLLRDRYEVFQFSKGGGLIQELVSQAFYFKQYKPDMVILHCGIVDCACRAFTHKEELFFQSNIIGKIIRKLLSTIITTKRIRNFRRKSWTTPKDFVRHLEQLKQQFSNIPVFALSILPVSCEYESKVPGIKFKVEKYNELLKESFGDKLIDLSDIQQIGIMSDGHHLTKAGHQYVLKKIIEKLLIFNL